MATARDFTDKTLEEMERHLTGIYTRAQKEVGKAWKAYMSEVNQQLSGMQKDYDAIKKTGDKAAIKKAGRELAAKKRERTLLNEHYQRLTKQMATQISHVNETAAAYINGKLPRIYAVNYNEVAEGVAAKIKGISFDLVDASTVKRLAKEVENLLPLKYVDNMADIRWNVSKINSEVLQGIVQGESIPHIADRMQTVLGMNRTSAIRNARTTVTSAENKGRMDMMREAREKGVLMHKIWLATHDNRTRHEHLELDGVEVDIDEPFENSLGEIMQPGDPYADPANVYNCRCRMTGKVIGFISPKTGEINYIGGD